MPRRYGLSSVTPESLLSHHFESYDQQRESSTLAMWLFLATEIMFFGGLFLVYLIYRNMYPEVFQLGSHELPIKWGAINTAVLICSSFTMAMTVRAAQLGQRKKIFTWMVLDRSAGSSLPWNQVD